MSDYTPDQRSNQLKIAMDKIEDARRQALFPEDEKGEVTATLAELVKAVYTLNATLQKIEKKIGANIQPQPGRLETPVKTTKTTRKTPAKKPAKKKVAKKK